MTNGYKKSNKQEQDLPNDGTILFKTGKICYNKNKNTERGRTMKTIRRALALTLCLAALLCCLLPGASASAPSISLTVLFTHDTHDHFYPDAADQGGYVRLATLLEEQRNTGAANELGADHLYPTVTLDAGDFSMGSLFQTTFSSDAPELKALGAMGYDVTTLGNHEFDYRAQGLADMLNAARASGERLPAMVQANYTTPIDPAASAGLTAALDNYPVTPYVFLEKADGVGLDGRSPMRIAVFGLMGLDAHESAPMSGMEYEPIADAARRVLAEIEAVGGADFVICLSHSGTEDGKGEDYELAKEVDGIDLIISGHTHSTTTEPIRVNDTYIVSCGSYTKNLGRITLSKKVSPDHELTAWDFHLIPVDGAVEEDPAMSAMAEELKAKVDANYLAGYGLTYDQVLTTATEDFTTEETGNLIGDAYIAAVKRVEGADYEPVAFAVAPKGVIRDRVRAGDVTTSQAFDILSLGVGADGTPGYPLLSLYLTGADLRNAFEVDASVSLLMPAAELYGAGMEWTWNPNRMILDKVTDGVQVLEDGTIAGIDDEKLYRVVADLYSGQMLGTVEGKSFGILAVTPRDENGQPVTDLESRILKQAGGAEVKAWYALASYLEGQDTVSPGPARKFEKASWNPIALLANPGAPTLAVMAVGLVLIGLVLVVVRLVRRRGKGNYRRYRGR